MEGRSRLSAAALSIVLALSVLGMSPAASAQSGPTVFHLPFPCGETWTASTRTGHIPNINAVDFNRPDDAGDAVLAGADGGVVSNVGAAGGWNDGLGDFVDVQFGDVELRFAHLQKPTTLKVSDPVNAQTVIGQVGGTGAANGAHHLHYEQRIDDAARPVVIEGQTWRLGIDVADDKDNLAANPGIPHPSANCSGTSDPGLPAEGPSGKPLSRPTQLPARVPWSAGQAHSLLSSYDSDSPEGFGLTFTGVASDAVYPLYAGAVVYAGCATGRSAPLGRIFVVRREVEGHTYDAVYGHLDPSTPLPSGPVGTDDPIGRFGSSVTSGTACTRSDGGPARLYVGMLRDATMLASGEISGGRPVYAEPLVGLGAYEKFTWWKGPATAIDLIEGDGAPTGRWTNKATKDGASVAFGDKVTLVAKVKDAVPMRELRFTAYYPDWAREKSAANLDGFNEKSTWRILAVCRPPGVQGEPVKTKGCRWDGSATDATVTFAWDPTVAEEARAVPWAPLSSPAITDRSTECVPVSLSFDIYDAAGYRVHGPAGSKRLERCRSATDEPGKVVNLQPPQPPAAPTSVRLVCNYYNPELDILEGKVVSDSCSLGPWPDPTLRWQDRSNDEQGFYIYARRKGGTWRGARCGPGGRFIRATSDWVRVKTLPPGTTSWRVPTSQVYRRTEPDFLSIEAELGVAAFNTWEESARAGEVSLSPEGDYC